MSVRLRRPGHGRPRHPRRLVLVGPIAALCIAILGAAPVGAASRYSADVFFTGAHERQVDGRTCTAAGVAMMMNMIARRDLNLSQMTILRYEQPRDALNDRVQRGSDPLGWSRAATYFSRYTGRPTAYRWEAYKTKTQALNRAATQIALTGKPVGLLVWHGRHAVVMTGFTSDRNPTKGPFTLSTIAISDPLGFTHRAYVASSYPLNTYLETDATAWYDTAWVGKYVIVVPQN